MTVLSEKFGIALPKVEPFGRSFPCVNPELVVGYELEIENCDDAMMYNKIAKKCNFMVHTDGSLRGCAYEFISKPMQSTHALAAMQEFLAYGKFGPENYSDRCSVHVHVNCTDMTQDQIAVVCLLYTVFEEIMLDFVGENRANNIYCIPWNQCRNHLNLVFNFLNNPTDMMRRWVKYTALNLNPLLRQGTIEFRQMHGTADMVKLTAWTNIIGAIFAKAKGMELKVLMEQIKTLNSTSEYEVFFRTIFGDVLEYSAEYKQKMEEGIIFAKYSMLNVQVPESKLQALVAELQQEAIRGAGQINDIADQYLIQRAFPMPRIAPDEPEFDQAEYDRDPVERELDEEME